MKNITYSISVRKICGQNGVTLDEYTNSFGDTYFVVKYEVNSDGKMTQYVTAEFGSQELATIYFNKCRGVK